MAYDWPGNVRQLENAVERALAFSQGRPQIEVQDLTPDVQAAPPQAAAAEAGFPEDGLDFEHYMSNVELTLIKQSARTHPGQQAPRRRAPGPEANDARRKAEAAGAARAALMPPRHKYWTIILEGKPTAFRAAEESELLPTLKQLQQRHPDAVMKWFAGGRLWTSPEEERLAQTVRGGKRESRGRGWRPGGEHRDPRERFKIPRDERRRRFRERLFDDRRDEPGDKPREGDTPAPRREPPRDRPSQDKPGPAARRRSAEQTAARCQSRS